MEPHATSHGQNRHRGDKLRQRHLFQTDKKGQLGAENKANYALFRGL